MRRIATLVSALALSIMSVVAVSNQASAATPYTLTANGTWISADGLLHGTWQAHFDVAGFDLSGTATILGLPDGIAEGNIAGSWDFDNIGFGIMFLDHELASFTGGLDGDHLIGQFETGDVIGNWSGLLSNLNISNIPIAPILDETLPTLLLNHTSGNVGDIVNLIATLYTVGAPIAGIENTIDFNALVTPILALANGTPDCTVNPGINKLDTIFEFLPKGCSGNTCKQVRAVVRSLSNLEQIANGANLYTCKVKIASDAVSGIYQVIAKAIKAVDVNNFQLPLKAISGEIGAKLPFFKQILGKVCHCSTAATAGTLPISSLLVPLALVALRRRARDRRLHS